MSSVAFKDTIEQIEQETLEAVNVLKELTQVDKEEVEDEVVAVMRILLDSRLPLSRLFVNPAIAHNMNGVLNLAESMKVISGLVKENLHAFVEFDDGSTSIMFYQGKDGEDVTDVPLEELSTIIAAYYPPEDEEGEVTHPFADRSVTAVHKNIDQFWDQSYNTALGLAKEALDSDLENTEDEEMKKFIVEQYVQVYPELAA